MHSPSTGLSSLVYAIGVLKIGRRCFSWELEGSPPASICKHLHRRPSTGHVCVTTPGQPEHPHAATAVFSHKNGTGSTHGRPAEVMHLK